MKRFKFSVFDDKWKPIFYTGLNLQIVWVSDALSEIEAIEKAKKAFITGVNFKLKESILLTITK